MNEHSNTMTTGNRRQLNVGIALLGNSYTYGNDLPGLISQLLPARLFVTALTGESPIGLPSHGAITA